jgi:hypothetical protein
MAVSLGLAGGHGRGEGRSEQREEWAAAPPRGELGTRSCADVQMLQGGQVARGVKVCGQTRWLGARMLHGG